MKIEKIGPPSIQRLWDPSIMVPHSTLPQILGKGITNIIPHFYDCKFAIASPFRDRYFSLPNILQDILLGVDDGA